MKLSKKYLIPALFGLLALHGQEADAAPRQAFSYTLNNHGKSLTTPVAWGASRNVVFMGAFGTIPAQYSSQNDGAAVLGVGLGDPKKNLGVQLSLISIDISEWKEYSSSLHLSKSLGNDDAIGAGVENVMLTDGGDAGKSFYIVYSRGIKHDSMVNKNIRTTRLHYSVGAGTGRFADKTPMDIATGKGEHGTYVFGNLAYEVSKSFNIITDWNGMNLNAGASKTIYIERQPITLTVALADLTHYSGDGIRVCLGAALGFKL